MRFPQPLFMQALRRERIGIIGAGNMGQALLAGMTQAGVAPGRIRIVEAHAATRRVIQRRFRVSSATLRAVARSCSVILLATKPQDLWPVAAELRVHLDARRGARPLIISIAAGLRLAELQRVLGPRPIVRVMPNLAAKVGASVSTLAPGRSAGALHVRVAEAIFQCVGDVVRVPERQFDIVTALSGSGPAYFFLIFHALRNAGIAQGLSPAVAERLVLQTALGSVRVVDELGIPLEQLVRQVASKGGTTEAALKVFAKKRLSAILAEGVAAAVHRSRELASTLKAPARRSR
jgi:pyrroline-5-carboxylate reductase